MRTLDVYPPAAAAGPRNLAADDLLLARAVAGRAGLRAYTWAEPTVSLGYFQPAADAQLVPGLAGLPVVRRATGGAAILHGDGDVTYALAIPAGVEPFDGESWVCSIHHVIRDVLRSYGASTRAVVCGEEKQLGPVLCFLHQTPGDLLSAGGKVVGSAERKQRGAVLQHGTVRLRAAADLPQLPGVLELAGVAIAPLVFAADLCRAIPAKAGWKVQPATFTAADEAEIAERAKQYAGAEWTGKR